MLQNRQNQLLLLASVLVIATCGLIYELVAGTLASYLLGDSVRQFSTIIGVYLFSMGIGSWLSRYVQRRLLFIFIQVEICVAIVGGWSSALLFFSFEQASGFGLILYSLVTVTGILVGMEIPLLMRILKDELDFRELVSQVFAFDYVGALFASLLFPLFLVPSLGLVRTSFLFGLMNIIVALVLCYRFDRIIPGIRILRAQSFSAALLLLAGFVFANDIQEYTESMSYQENIIYSKSTPYQRIVLTSSRGVSKLYLNNNLQFSSADEYRYHEALVHPGMSRIGQPQRVLILGGGDGLALREVLKYPAVRQVVLVDLDSAITGLFRSADILTALNNHSLSDPKVTVINVDAFRWVRECKEKFDFVVIDFPDPSGYSVGKLYSNAFYRELQHVVAENGAFVVQSTSPYVAPLSFWCVNRTIESVGFRTVPYHVYVPSFGEWGFVLGGHELGDTTFFLPPGLKYYDAMAFKEMKRFPRDMAYKVTQVNKLNNQVLVQYFDDEWGKVQ